MIQNEEKVGSDCEDTVTVHRQTEKSNIGESPSQPLEQMTPRLIYETSGRNERRLTSTVREEDQTFSNENSGNKAMRRGRPPNLNFANLTGRVHAKDNITRDLITPTRKSITTELQGQDT